MISFKKAKIVSRKAYTWFVGFFIFLLLLAGSFFRFYLKTHLDGNDPKIQVFFSQLDKVLVYFFWGLLLIVLVYGFFYVRLFFGPLSSLISKASAIRKGSLNIKKSEVIKESRGEWYQLDLSLNKIWKDLKTKKADVEKERNELEALLTAANDAILAVDRDMNIRYYNAPMALLFDQKEEGNWGRKLTEILRSQTIIEGFNECLKTQKSQRVQAQHEMSVDSAIHYFQVSISPFWDEKKSRTRGAVAIFHDITDHKKLEKVRMDFVANASHELKTPLTSIQGYLGLIKEKNDLNDSIVENSFSVVESNLFRLNKLIQDLLELSKIESTESVALTSVDTKVVTENVLHDLSGQIEDKKSKIEVIYEIEKIKANEDLLQHVLMNLIENSVKYTQAEAHIKVRWGELSGAYFLSVKDNGPGIESYHQGRLFERFYRVRDEQNQNARGTGLGLSIVRNCMVKMKGSVDLKSAPGLGSEFICYFKK